MGIFILPFLIAALCVMIMASIETIKKLRAKEIGIKEILFGFLIASSIYGLIVLSYVIEGRAWAASTAIRIPTFMFLIPFGIHFVTKTNPKERIRYISVLLLVSTAAAGILGLLLNDMFFGIPAYLGIEEYH